MGRRSLGWIMVAAIALFTVLLSARVPLLPPAQSSEPTSLLAQAPLTESPELTADLTLSGTFEDPQGNFQIGILEGAATSTVSGSPMFELPNGSLAYSVVTVPLMSESPLSDIALAEIARQTLSNGEGFQSQTFTSVPNGGLQIVWSGRLSQRGAPQPVSGSMLVRQQGMAAYVLVVAALESAAPMVPSALATLVESFNIL
ncbi:MAG: hypothetical protein ACFBSG_11810 [Leptolyngbyaceae cyanobacterium]